MRCQNTRASRKKFQSCMATFPARFSVIGKAVQSLLDQRLPPTRILIHVNESDVPPPLPDDDRIEVYCSPDENLTDIGKFKMTEKVSENIFSPLMTTSSTQKITLNLISIGFSDLTIKSSQDSTVRCSRSTNQFKLGRITKSSSCTLVQTWLEYTFARSNPGNGNNGLPRENPSV